MLTRCPSCLKMLAQRTAVILFPWVEPAFAGVTILIRIRWLESAGTKACPDVSSIRSVEIAVGVVNEPRTCRPTTAAKHFVIAEPRLQIGRASCRERGEVLVV